MQVKDAPRADVVLARPTATTKSRTLTSAVTSTQAAALSARDDFGSPMVRSFRQSVAAPNASEESVTSWLSFLPPCRWLMVHHHASLPPPAQSSSERRAAMGIDGLKDVSRPKPHPPSCAECVECVVCVRVLARVLRGRGGFRSVVGLASRRQTYVGRNLVQLRLRLFSVEVQ